MKLIAHRGACLEAQEDTLVSLMLGASYGAYAVECDPRFTRDGVAVIFHDGNLKRLAGDPRRVDELTYEEMKQVLAGAGKTLTTLDEVLENYKGESVVLFDLPENASDEALYRRIADAPFPVIAGVHAVDEAMIARKYFPKEQILAFMPRPEAAAEFAEAGVGIIRLWEQWLPEHPIAEVRKVIPADRKIWIMSRDMNITHPLFCMNGSPDQLDRLYEQGADGVLLNDIAMAVKHVTKSR